MGTWGRDGMLSNGGDSEVQYMDLELASDPGYQNTDMDALGRLPSSFWFIKTCIVGIQMIL
jgi:hypothetical protein